MELKTKQFWDVVLVDASEEEWRAKLGELVVGQSDKLTVVMTPNPEQLVLAARDERFHECLRRADYLIPDGAGLVWASGVQARLTGSDSVEEILKLSKKCEQLVLVVGGRYESSNGRLVLEVEGEKVEVNYTPGYEDVRAKTGEEEKRVQNVISEVKPTIVLVALGAPAQEEWIVEHREVLERAGARLVMAVGGSIDFVTGKRRRAPRGWQKWKLEWLYRLLQEPSRWRRQLALPVFVVKKLTGQWRTVQKRQSR